MSSKNVLLSNGVEFESLQAANLYFDGLRERPKGTTFSGQELDNLRALYEDYCRVTKYPVPGKITGFHTAFEPRPGGSHPCFFVEFESGKPKPFSQIKALKEIANK